jgi:uncharacterized protein YbjQ (UPF0145 family)
MPQQSPSILMLIATISIGLLIPLVFLGAFFGVIWLIASGIEKRHEEKLLEREASLGGLALTSQRRAPADGRFETIGLCSGNVVIGVNAIRVFQTIGRMIVGGECVSLGYVMRQGRREAIVRLRRAARNMGATHVINVRIDTSPINGGSGGSNRNNAMIIEFIAYGTAIRSAA